MMYFDEYDLPAQKITVCYAQKLNNSLIERILLGEHELSNKEEAEMLTYFFWEIVDLAVDDEQNDVSIAGFSDLQSWLEKAMHIFTGYIKKCGFEDQWKEVSKKCQ